MLWAFMVLCLATAAPAPSQQQKIFEAEPTLVIERTYLKAATGQREALAKFIIANWFELDRIAKAQGLFTQYRLSENVDHEGEWDFEVAVSYPNSDGYQNVKVQTQFGEIRKAHKVILINGLGLKDLGRIVRSDRIRPREEG